MGERVMSVVKCVAAFVVAFAVGFFSVFGVISFFSEPPGEVQCLEFCESEKADVVYYKQCKAFCTAYKWEVEEKG